MKKINKKNTFMLSIFVVSMSLVVHDLFILITKINSCWTAWGIISFCLSAIIAELSYEYLEDKIKSAGISYTSASTNQ